MLGTRFWMFFLTLGATFLPSGGALASTRGEIGAVSKARVSISVSVAQKLSISDARIVTAADQRVVNSNVRAVDFCVEGRTATGRYTVEFLAARSQSLTSVQGLARRPGSCSADSSTSLGSSNPILSMRAKIDPELHEGALTLILAAD